MKILLVLILLPFTFQAQTVILNEDFEGDISAWSSIVNDTNTVVPVLNYFQDGWAKSINPDDNQDSVISCTSYFNTPAKAERWLVSPSINLGGFGNFVSWKAKSQDPSYPDDLLVLISTTNDFSSNVDTILLAYQISPEWTDFSFQIDSSYTNETVYLAFVLQTNDGYILHIDDIIVEKESSLKVSKLIPSEYFIFPNPCQDYFYFSTKNVSSVELYSTFGVLIKKFNSETAKFSTESIEKGSYLVIIKDKDLNIVYSTILIKK